MMMQAGIQRGSSVHRISVQGSLVQGEEQGKGDTRGGENWAECVREGTGGGRGTWQKVHRLRAAGCIFGSCLCRTG